MHFTTTFDVAVPSDRLVTYLGDPRHLIVANHKGPVVEQSDGPVATGSWFVLAFDQVRVRVEYTAYGPLEVAASVSSSGRGAGGAKSRCVFVLSELDGGTGTRVSASFDGEGGWLRWAPLMRLSHSITWRRLRHRIEALA